MKKVQTILPLTLGLALMPVLSDAQSEKAYFCTIPGTTLYYECHDAESGKLTQTTFFEIISVQPTPDGGQHVDYCVTMRNKRGKPILGGRTSLSVDIDAAGNSYMDFGATIRGFVQNMFKKTDFKSEGEPAVMPFDMKPGDTLPDVHCVVKAGAVKLTVEVSGRTVLRNETITTPAGSFQCVVCREHKVENAPLHHWDAWSDTWYAPGIGFVRHDVLKDNMEVETSDYLVKREHQLISFADPKNDPASVGPDTPVIQVNDSYILDCLDKAGATDVRHRGCLKGIKYLATKSFYGGRLDFTAHEEYGIDNKALYVTQTEPEGAVAHNNHNFGNFLWGASAKEMGVPLHIALLGSHMFNYFFSRSSKGQLDSPDDIFSIRTGYHWQH